MTLFLLALAAGALSVLAPCVLTVLPGAIGSGANRQKARLALVALGFVLAFGISASLQALAGGEPGLSIAALRGGAAIFLGLFGATLILRRPSSANAAPEAAAIQAEGGEPGARTPFFGLAIGTALGLAWTPCAGPILGAVLALAATHADFFLTLLLLSAYGTGAALTLFGAAHVAGRALERSARSGFLRKVLGMLIIAAAILTALGLDRPLQDLLVQLYPEQLPFL